ncbi:MAG: magnesium-translocating P-type ATPase [Steroidobacteraceae bacterium]
MKSTNKAYWSVDAVVLTETLGSRMAGLTSDEASERLVRRGLNVIKEGHDRTFFSILLRQFSSPLVLILLFGAVVSLTLRDWSDALIIFVIVAGSTALGCAQEYRASRALAQLRARLALTVRVRRDGKVVTVPARDLVIGDVIELVAGNLVPADGVILEARDFLLTEAALTGESFPVEKRPGVVSAQAGLAERSNCVFLGTSVRSGTATVLIAQTGASTAYGGIAAQLAQRAPESEFERGVRRFGYLLLQVMLAIVIFVLIVNQLLGRSGIESMLFAVALAVGLSPELLPAIVNVTLARGAHIMAREGVMVRRMDAIENLGSMDVLCTDKTGTLTSGSIALHSAVDPGGRISPDVLRLAWLNATLETGIANPLDAALVNAGTQANLQLGAVVKVDEIPYDFLRKRLTIMVSEQGNTAQHLLICKGAVTNVLAICTHVASATGEQPLDAAERARIEAWFEQQGVAGLRVLAVGSRRLAAKPHYDRADERGLCLMGFLLFYDPPKPGVETAIAQLAALGVRIKVITGDNRHVAAHVAQSVGLKADAMITGEELMHMGDDALWQRAPQTDLFVEIDPQQKERIVRALQRRGHAVGYLGDGINDAPALHVADVGISVDDAVDVARESADVVLLQPDLTVLRIGVEQGRRTFANTLKYIRITTSANFGNMISMALATPLLPFLPLVAKQILFNNFISDLPTFALSLDNVDHERLQCAQHWDLKSVLRFMVVFGLISTAFDIMTFMVLLHGFKVDEGGFQTVWFMVSLLTELAVLLLLRTALPVWRSRPGKTLLWLTIVVALAALAIPFSGPLAEIFGFEPLSLVMMATVLLIVMGYAIATEVGKWLFFRNKKT